MSAFDKLKEQQSQSASETSAVLMSRLDTVKQ